MAFSPGRLQPHGRLPGPDRAAPALGGHRRAAPVTSQVDSYLTDIGPAGTTVREAICQDPTLWNLLDTPLMLNIITVAYADQPGSQPQLSGTLKERRDHLFGAYVDQMFRRRGVGRRYTPQQTVDWLTWLAWQMVQHSQTVFYIERLQPDWLPGEQRWAFRLLYRCDPTADRSAFTDS